MRGRDIFQKVKPVIGLMVKWYNLFPKKLRLIMFERARKKTGSFAILKRYALLKTLAKHVGDNVTVFPDAYLRNVQELEIGNNVSIHPMCYIEALGGVKIGDDVSIAEGTSMFSINHGYSDLKVPIKDQESTLLPIEIKNNVWLGAKATVLGGVCVAEGTIVAAGAVVTKSTQPFTTVAGVPARMIRNRLQEEKV